MSETTLILASALKEGDTIGVAAPAGPFPRERFDKGTARLRALGFHVVWPSQIYDRDGFLAGSDASRAQTLTRLWADEKVKAIIGARGGYGTMRILSMIDYSLLKANPKIIIGFSDLTALLMSCIKETGLVVFHGPVVTSLADADLDTAAHLKRMLTGEQVFPLALDRNGVMVRGRASGPLLGGNLTLLIHLLASRQLPDLEGAILFLEDVGEAPYRLDRKLTTLRAAGVLERCAGVLYGQFENCGPVQEVRDVLARNLNGFSGPAACVQAGHGSRNLTLPLGPRAMLDTDRMVLDMVEPYLN